MANHFNLTYSTVKIHMHNIRLKLGVKNRTQILIAWKKRSPPTG